MYLAVGFPCVWHSSSARLGWRTFAAALCSFLDLVDLEQYAEKFLLLHDGLAAPCICTIFARLLLFLLLAVVAGAFVVFVVIVAKQIPCGSGETFLLRSVARDAKPNSHCAQL